MEEKFLQRRIKSGGKWKRSSSNKASRSSYNVASRSFVNVASRRCASARDCLSMQLNMNMFWLPPKVETHGKPQSLVSMVKHEYQIEKRDRERESAGSRNILVGHTQVSRRLDTCLHLFGSITTGL